MKVTIGRTEETAVKLALLRTFMGQNQAFRLRGTDWFAWATAGGSPAVPFAAESGSAELLITPETAWIVTDTVEGERLRTEEVPAEYAIHASSWAHPAEKEAFLRQITGTAGVFSDRPETGESPLPTRLLAAKRTMTLPEIERYRRLGRAAAAAMTEAMLAATPAWTEWELAAAGAGALLSRGLQPALLLAAGERRLPLYRQPLPTTEPLGNLAMLTLSARQYGLYANLTRFICFGRLPSASAEVHRHVWEVEQAALAQSRPGRRLDAVYRTVADMYQAIGHPGAIHEFHQGGTTGYRRREVVALPDSPEILREYTPVAWNPSLRGAKVEDTFLVRDGGVENLTVDEVWPMKMVGETPRPLVMEK